MYTDDLKAALSLLECSTPLNSDCGLLCNGACCRDNGEAGSGVWLLPQEDDTQMDWGDVKQELSPATHAKMNTLYCRGMCKRQYRPFMCRIFPLSPYYSKKQQAWDVRMDRRAAAVCPLFGYGKKGLSSEFVNNAREAVRILSGSGEGQAVLEMLEAEESVFRMEL